MKKIFLLFILFSCSALTIAQTVLPDSVELNLLNAPSNPAFNLMGVSTNSIERPTDLNSFRLSIQNATSNFAKFPTNYAIELSPASIFWKKSQTLSQFNSSKFSDVWRQSLSVSFAYSKSNAEDKETDDSTSYTKFGIGFKVSLIRPKWTAGTAERIDSFYSLLRKVLDASKQATIVDSTILALQNEFSKVAQDISLGEVARSARIKAITEQLAISEKRRATIINARTKDSSASKDLFAIALADIAKFSKGMKVERKGAFLDFATGLAFDFPDSRFNYSLVSKAGAWVTGGYENGNQGFSFMGIGRYLYQPDKIYADDSNKIKTKNISTFDAGARVSLNALQGKFSLNAEAIYRSVLKDNIIKPSWRFTFNAEYNVGFNQKITFAIGRNFNGTVTKDGNLIAAINFIRGFGSNKKITGP